MTIAALIVFAALLAAWLLAPAERRQTRVSPQPTIDLLPEAAAG
jgi:hypothetical protein